MIEEDERPGIVWEGRWLVVFMDELAAKLPLHHRTIIFDTNDNTKSIASIYICSDGHIHMTAGMSVCEAIQVMAGLYAYTIALTVDGRDRTEVTKGFVGSIAKQVRRVISEVDEEIADNYATNIRMVRYWLEHGGPLYFRDLMQERKTPEADEDPTEVTYPVGIFGNVNKGEA